MKNIKLILIIFTICSVIIRCGSKSIDKTSFKEGIDTLLIRSIFENENKAKIVLLSIKYNIDIKVTGNIIGEYLSKHDYFYIMNKTIINALFRNDSIKNQSDLYKYNENNLDIMETITQLSIKYNLPIYKIASLIIDYKIWVECEQKSTD